MVELEKDHRDLERRHIDVSNSHSTCLLNHDVILHVVSRDSLLGISLVTCASLVSRDSFSVH